MGYLKGIRNTDVRGLIEVKPFFRRKGLLEVRIQEAAQSVAWIMEDPEISLVGEVQDVTG